MPWHLPTMQKQALIKSRESQFSLVWFMDFSIISSCLGKGKVYPIIFNVSTKAVNRFYVSNGAK